MTMSDLWLCVAGGLSLAIAYWLGALLWAMTDDPRGEAERDSREDD